MLAMLFIIPALWALTTDAKPFPHNAHLALDGSTPIRTRSRLASILRRKTTLAAAGLLMM